MEKKYKPIHFVHKPYGKKEDKWGYLSCNGILSAIITGETDADTILDEGKNTYNTNKVTCPKCRQSLAFKIAREKQQYPLFNLPGPYYEKNRKANSKKVSRVIPKSNKRKKQKSRS